jgi:hypothetical protein
LIASRFLFASNAGVFLSSAGVVRNADAAKSPAARMTACETFIVGNYSSPPLAQAPK